MTDHQAATNRQRAEEIVDRHWVKYGDFSVRQRAIDDITYALDRASRPAPGHVRDSDGREFNLWSTLRSGLTYCRDLIEKCGDVKDYESESAYFDAIARKLADHATGTIRDQIEQAAKGARE